MEAISLPSFASSNTLSFQSRKRKLFLSPFQAPRIPTPITPSGFQVRAEQSVFQDFQSYVKPSRLVPGSEVKVCTNALIERISLSLKEDTSKSLFRVKLCTSNMYGSSLSNLNAGVLLCLIDEDGNSILQRIPASLMIDHSTETGDINDVLHFQRGFMGDFIFEGPKIARVKALWIGVESGQWRLGSVSITVLSCEFNSSLEDEMYEYTGFQYDFQTEDVLLGEGSDLSMLEMRPSLVTEFGGVDPFIYLSKIASDNTLPQYPKISNEESMREYADLKFSLLLYDAMLVFFGTSFISLSVGKNEGFAFLLGGIGGFLYLLLLQRSVDELPVPESITRDRRESSRLLGGLKGPLWSVALAIGFALCVVRYGSGDLQVSLTPKEVIVGMMGFLACKVSVVLAAYKPMTLHLKSPSDK
ncbi:hypothetical protein QN277_027550 [Acacia crassicarpa]|uniref:DUF7755 domain-containing protein n=1 Tax=Acacia crassicarpa TaxID=499986 RepID=A0AAE1MM49_9FABA|nr:hypothetical protein QN277_027550 [Acacia crassicarpa]